MGLGSGWQLQAAEQGAGGGTGNLENMVKRRPHGQGQAGKDAPYLAEEFLHEGLGPAAVNRPLLGGVADVSSMKQQRQGLGLVNPVGAGGKGRETDPLGKGSLGHS